VVFRKINDPDFLAHVRQVSSYLDESLQDLAADMPDRILELRGRGLMRGIRIAGSAGAAREAAHSQGLLVATAGDDVIRLLPPLVIDTGHVDAAIAKLREVLS
jgi:acetylornithine/N-succinyldiaminopimelate aminotransferase